MRLQQNILHCLGGLGVQVIEKSHIELGSDHAAVACEFVLGRIPYRRRLRRNKQCGTHVVDKPKLSSQISAGALDFRATETPAGQWEAIKILALGVSYRTLSLKYKDPEDLKTLCAQRQSSADPVERARLTRLIISRRHIAKRQWWTDLKAKASQGSSAAIKYIRQRAKPRTSLGALVQASGGQQPAASKLQERMEGLFCAEDPPHRTGTCVRGCCEVVVTEFHCPAGFPS